MTSETIDTEISLAFCLLQGSTYLQVVVETTAILVDDGSGGFPTSPTNSAIKDQLSKVC